MKSYENQVINMTICSQSLEGKGARFQFLHLDIKDLIWYNLDKIN